MNDNQLYIVDNLYYASVLNDGNLGSIYFRGVNNGVYRGRIRFAHAHHNVYISHDVTNDPPLQNWITTNAAGNTNDIIQGNWQHNNTNREIYGQNNVHPSLGVFRRINVQNMNPIQRGNISHLLSTVVPALRQNQANANDMQDLHNAILQHVVN
jgi:hypothetical protein